MNTVLTALYETPKRAADAVRALEAAGIPSDDISLLIGDHFDRDAFTVETHSKLSEGVAAGAVTGGALGALIAGLTAVGAFATGGGLLVAGPIVAALAGAGAGATGGGVLGGLIGATMPEHEVKHYEDALEKGSVMVGVTCATDDIRDRVQHTLKETGAIKISRA